MFNLKKIFGGKGKATDENYTLEDLSKGVTEAVSTLKEEVAAVSEEALPMTVKEKRELSTRLEEFLRGGLYLLVFLSPLFFLPVVADWFDLPKETFLFLGVMLCLLAFVVRSFLSKKTAISRTSWDLPIIVLVTVAAVSGFLSPNRMMAMTTEPVTIFTGAAIFFLIGSTLGKEEHLRKLVLMLGISAALISLWSLVQLVFGFIGAQIGGKVAFFPLTATFSVTGSMLTQLMVLAAVLPAVWGLWQSAGKDKGKSSFALALVVVITGGILIALFDLYRSRPILLPYDSGWRIATGSLGQSLMSAFLGVSPAHFLDAFTLYKPAELNNTSIWNLRFTTSSNYYLYVLTTLGIGGLAALVWLIYRFSAAAKKRLDTGLTSALEKGLIGSAAAILGLVFFLPGPQIVIFMLFVFLGLLVVYYRQGEVTAVVKVDEEIFSGTFRLGVAALTIAILGAGGYFLGRAVLADYYYNQSLLAAAANRGGETYNLQIQAIRTNPDNDAYHVAYSQTNLAVADALAAQPNLTDQQKSAVVQLVQQAIREARVAVTLQPKRAGDYENLSLIYRNLINFAQGADQWAILAEQQAINFDPTNPRLRLDLGGIYLTLKDFQSAGQTFATAVQLKPDYANAHYNLAQALRELKLTDQAGQQLQLTATLVCGQDANSADCQRVNGEIAALAAAGTKQATPPAEAVAPQAPLATSAAQKPNLPKVKPTPPPKIASPGGELAP